LFWASLVYLALVVGIIGSRGRVLQVVVSVAGMLPLVGRRLRIDPAKMQEIEQAFSPAAFRERPLVLVRILALEIPAQAILVGERYWTIRSMGVAISGWSAVLGEVMTRALTVVEFVGATEVGFAVVFTWLGMPAAIGFSLSLVKTLRSLTTAG